MTDQEDVTNPEGTEEVTEEEDVTEDSEDEGDEPSDEEKAALIEENRILKEKNAKLYDKLKSWYKKWATVKEKIKTEYVSKDDVRKIYDEIQKDKEDETRLVEKFEDAKEILSEVQKARREKSLSYDEAYALVKGKMFTDEGYRNQIASERTAKYWDVIKKEQWFKYAHLFTTPEVSKPRKTN